MRLAEQSGEVVDEARAAEVAVSWRADRHRFSRVVDEFPLVRSLRRAAVFVAVTSAVLVLIDVWVDDFTVGRVRFTDTNSPWMWFALISMNVFFVGLYVLLRRSVLDLASPGSRTWRLSESGLRVESVSSGEGDELSRSSVNEYPWGQLVRWYCVKEHLMVEIRRPNGKSPHLAVAVPMAAFSEAEWAATQERLVEHLGTEG